MPFPSEFDPPPGAFCHRFSVEPSDIDGLGHANNVVWVRWVNEAAIRHSHSVGLEPSVYLSLEAIWVVRRHDIEYLLPAFAGETLEALTWVASLRGATSLRRTVIQREGRVLSRVATTWALIDTTTQKPRRIPKELMERYGFSAGT